MVLCQLWLEQLNRDYVASGQHRDMRRFDEILAPEFYCSNPDGSLVDRRAFLEQTARPVTISGLEPKDVLIRLFGDVAIIHADELRCRRRRGKVRPLHRCLGAANGRWPAVSAHLTRA